MRQNINKKKKINTLRSRVDFAFTNDINNVTNVLKYDTMT